MRAGTQLLVAEGRITSGWMQAASCRRGGEECSESLVFSEKQGGRGAAPCSRPIRHRRLRGALSQPMEHRRDRGGVGQSEADGAG